MDAPHPEDVFIDPYMPGASPAERDAARRNVRALIAALLQIDRRLRREKSDSRKAKERGRVGMGDVSPAL